MAPLRFIVHAVKGAGIGHDTLTIIGGCHIWSAASFSLGLDDHDQLEAIFFCKFKIALIMGGTAMTAPVPYSISTKLAT